MYFQTTVQSKRDCDDLPPTRSKELCQKRVLMNFQFIDLTVHILCFLSGVMLPKFMMTALFVILSHSAMQVTLASVMQCKGATRSIPDRVLAGHVSLTKPCKSIVACVMLCDDQRPLCQSINYYQNTKVCELNNKTADSSPKDMKDYEWAIYMTNGMRLLSCNDSDFQCGGQTDICQITPSGNKCKGIASIFYRANQL